MIRFHLLPLRDDNFALWTCSCKWHSVLFPHRADSPRPIITHLEDAHQHISGDNVCIYSCKKIKIKTKNRAVVTVHQRPLWLPWKHGCVTARAKRSAARIWPASRTRKCQVRHAGWFPLWSLISAGGGVGKQTWQWSERSRGRGAKSPCVHSARRLHARYGLRQNSRFSCTDKGAAGLSVSEVDCLGHWWKPTHDKDIRINCSTSCVFSKAFSKKSWDLWRLRQAAWHFPTVQQSMIQTTQQQKKALPSRWLALCLQPRAKTLGLKSLLDGVVRQA